MSDPVVLPVPDFPVMIQFESNGESNLLYLMSFPVIEFLPSVMPGSCWIGSVPQCSFCMFSSSIVLTFSERL